jgi:hypothetical protein
MSKDTNGPRHDQKKGHSEMFRQNYTRVNKDRQESPSFPSLLLHFSFPFPKLAKRYQVLPRVNLKRE